MKGVYNEAGHDCPSRTHFMEGLHPLSRACHMGATPGDHPHASSGRGIHPSRRHAKIYYLLVVLVYVCTSTQAPIDMLGERPLEMRGRGKERSIDAGWTI